MATTDQKYIRTEYTDGSVVLSNLRNKKGIPIVGLDASYTASKVTTWYDGTPMDDSKADGKVYLKLKDTGEYFKVNLPNDKELFLEKDTMAQMRAISTVEILLLKMGYFRGVKLNGYYSKGDTPAPIEYYLSDVEDEDDGGSVIEVNGVKLEHIFTSEVEGEYFGMKSLGVDNTTIVQKIIDYTITKPVLKAILPKWYRINYGNFNIPNNISIKTFGNTAEEREFYNNINPNGTPVNEKEILSGYHTGFVLDVKDNIKPEIREAYTKRATSVVRRFNGFGRLQEIDSSLGTKFHSLDYLGLADIVVTGNATSSGNISITLNGQLFQVPILSGDTTATIRTKLQSFNYGDYWANKVISGTTVRIAPPHEVIIVVSDKVAVDGNYPVSIDGVTYNIPVLATDSTRAIATKIVNSPLIPEDKYIRYSQASCVVIYHKSGEVSTGTTVSTSTNVQGITIESSVFNYTNYFNRLVFSPNGNVAIGMWNARKYQLEIANSLRILSNSTENNVQGATAIFILENEDSNQYKALQLDILDRLNILNTAKTSVFRIDNNGDITQVRDVTLNAAIANRLRFRDKNRFITTNVLGAEDAVYISNNAGTAYTVRISDTTGIEVFKGGVWKPVDALATTTTTGLVKQSMASADSAAAPGETYTQAEVQAILDELRDLKTKLRTAGILAI